jgi:hypothetical protein
VFEHRHRLPAASGPLHRRREPAKRAAEQVSRQLPDHIGNACRCGTMGRPPTKSSSDSAGRMLSAGRSPRYGVGSFNQRGVIP